MEQGGPGGGFTVVLRGYDRVQVEEYIDRLAAALQRLTAGEWVEPPPSAQFDIALRGYDRSEVDAYIQEMMDAGQRLARRFGP